MSRRGKRLMAGILAATMLASCAQTNTKSNSATESVAYAYQDELQLLDDNYRNYYEIFVYSFCDSDGDGIGDLNGVTQKLDYITDMGFTGIWLMPILKSTTYHKYDIVDYYEIDPDYGTMADFEALAAACKEKGVKLILDLAINHTSAQNEWFLSACKSLQTDNADNNPYCEFTISQKTRQTPVLTTALRGRITTTREFSGTRCPT